MDSMKIILRLAKQKNVMKFKNIMSITMAMMTMEALLNAKVIQSAKDIFLRLVILLIEITASMSIVKGVLPPFISLIWFDVPASRNSELMLNKKIKLFYTDCSEIFILLDFFE